MQLIALPDWRPVASPPREPLLGRYVRLEPLDPARHGDDLWLALQGPQADPALWDYLPYGPFTERGEFAQWLAAHASSRDPLFFSVLEQSGGVAVGLLSFLNIQPQDGCIEIGHVAFGAALQRSCAASETIYLLGKLAFELGYRRLEWKCNAANARSKRAAERFGFSYEGLFRQHRVIKGHNRDTAWYSLLDHEWPARAAAFERWLAADNFDAGGQQLQRLQNLREAYGE
jgi:RimJ/RimL family protein N-acetyltransferase